LAYYGTKEYVRAIAEFDQYLAVVPQNYMVLSNRAGAYLLSGNVSAARVDIDRALALGPNDVTLRENRVAIAEASADYATVINDCSWLIEHFPPKAKWLLKRGKALGNESRHEEALADLQRVIEMAPSVEALFFHGLARYFLMQYPPAIEDFTKTLAIDPGYAPAYRWRCMSYYQLQSFAIGLADCDEFVRRAPQLYVGYYNRGILRSRVGDQAGAIDDYRRAIQLSQDARDTSNAWYGVGLASQRGGRMKDARDAYRRAVDADPANRQARDALARVK